MAIGRRLWQYVGQMPRLVNTTLQRLVPAKSAGYSSLIATTGESESLRNELGGDASELASNRSTTLLRLLHITDMHLMDAGSPARADWVEARATETKWLPLLHMARPHDLLANSGSVAFSRAIAETGEAADIVIFTGDNIDNAQRNELDAFLSVAGGGTFGFSYDGPQTTGWALDLRAKTDEFQNSDGLWPFWLPEGGTPDRFQQSFGFPTIPDLIEAATRSVSLTGLGHRWISALGNHDVMRQGTVFSSAELELIAVGGWRALGARVGFDPVDPMGTYLDDPASFSDGYPRFPVPPVPERRSINRSEFISAHIGLGVGGFSSDGSGDYVVDTDNCRVIVLDTNHPTGHYQGSLGTTQLEWLDERLREVTDHPVVVASHHGSVSLDNTFRDPYPTDRRLAADVREVLLRYGNVVAWLVGHRHVNRIRPIPNPDPTKAGLWEITTASVIDFPCQIRGVSIVRGADGSIGVRTEVFDHDAHQTSLRGLDDAGLSAWHREIAFNTERVYSGRESKREGRPNDRNAFLARPLP